MVHTKFQPHADVIMAKILLVDDDRQLTGMVHDWLKSQNHSVDVAHDGGEAADRLKWYQYDLAILDWELPVAQGIDVCRQYRLSGGKMPILMLTGKREVGNRIDGLDAGADDYLVKPFDLSELAARVRALMRRPATVITNVLTVRNITFELDGMRVLVDGKEVNLPPKELALLEFLMKHPGQLFSSEALIDRVWPTDSDASPEAVRTYINRLRKKLDTDGQPSLFKTVHGLGYKIEP